MFTTGSKLLLGATTFAILAAVVMGAANAGAIGWTSTIGLAGAAVALAALSAIVLWFRDNNVDPASGDGVRVVEAAEAPLRRSFVPVGGALGVGVVIAGLATRPAVFKAGVLLLVAVAAEWIVASIQARSAHRA